MLDANEYYPGKKFREPWDKAVAELEMRVRENPEDVSAYVGLAEHYILLWCFGFLSRDESLPKAKEAIKRAKALAPDCSAVHTILGALALSDWNWAGAEEELNLAIELETHNPKPHHWYALYLSAMGRHSEALAESMQSVKLEPSVTYKTGFGSILYFAKDFERMVEVMEEVVAEAPTFAPGYDWLGMAYVQLGRYEESIQAYQKAVELSDGAAEVKAGLGHAYGVAGRKAEAKAILDELLALSKKWYVPPVQIAFVYVGLGELDKTFEMLETAYKERAWELVFVREEPWFSHLHSDPRFINLLKAIKFPEKNL